MERQMPNPEHAWAAQEMGRQFRVPTQEPHYTKKDDNLMKYLFERCIVFEWGKDGDGNPVRVAAEIKYQDLLDAAYFRLSHLESVSYLTSAHASVQYSKWRLSYHIAWSKYESLGDQDALELLREIDLTIFNIINGRAHMGTHQKYDAAVAGSRRTMTIENGEQRGGLRGRLGL